MITKQTLLSILGVSLITLLIFRVPEFERLDLVQTIIGLFAIGLAIHSINNSKDMQRRSERLTYYQYKLGVLNSRSEKAEEASNNPEITKYISKAQLLSILLKNKGDYVLLQDKMKKEFGFDD